MDVDKVKLAVVGRFGRDITDLSDAQDLAQEVQAETGENLSYNTIRRFFGLVKYNGATSKRTLDILCRYLGYSGYQEFEKLPMRQKEISEYQVLMHSPEIDFEVNFAEQLIATKNARDILGLAYLLKYLLVKKEFTKVSRILSKSVRLRLTEDYYENCVALANFCGSAFLEVKDEKWLKYFLQKTAYPQVVLLFYNSSYSRNPHYYDQLNLLYRFSADPEEKLFCLAGLATRSLFNKDRSLFLEYVDLIEQLNEPDNLATDLKARLLTIDYLKSLYKGAGTEEKAWQNLIEGFKTSSHKVQFLKEPISLCFGLELDQKCKELLSLGRFSKWEIRHWTENGLNQVFHIAQAYYAYHNGDFTLYLRHKRALEKKYWFASIYDLLDRMHRRLAQLV